MFRGMLIAVGLVCFLASNILAQQQMQDVVYLKDGSVIRGTIIEQVPNVSVKIQTKDGSMFVCKMENIEKITKEPVVTPPPVTEPTKPPVEEKDFKPFAEIYLGRFAQEAEENRKDAATTRTIVGPLIAAGGMTVVVLANSGKIEDRGAAYTLGGIGTALGVGILISGRHLRNSKSDLMKEYERIQGMDATTFEARFKREETAKIIIHKLAVKARNARLYTAVGEGIPGLFLVAFRPFKVTEIHVTETSSYYEVKTKKVDSPYNFYIGVPHIAAALKSLLFKSYEEKAYEEYLREKEGERKFSFFIGGREDMRLALVYRF